jgi:hypothetical protein
MSGLNLILRILQALLLLASIVALNQIYAAGGRDKRQKESAKDPSDDSPSDTHGRHTLQR